MLALLSLVLLRAEKVFDSLFLFALKSGILIFKSGDLVHHLLKQ